jgi:hypothetical protein
MHLMMSALNASTVLLPRCTSPLTCAGCDSIACVRAGYVQSSGGRAAQPACECCAPAPP